MYPVPVVVVTKQEIEALLGPRVSQGVARAETDPCQCIGCMVERLLNSGPKQPVPGPVNSAKAEGAAQQCAPATKAGSVARPISECGPADIKPEKPSLRKRLAAAIDRRQSTADELRELRNDIEASPQVIAFLEKWDQKRVFMEVN